jgi:hypothetical protein
MAAQVVLQSTGEVGHNPDPRPAREEGGARSPCQVVARRGKEEPVAPTKPGPADGPTEHLKLVAKDHDSQVRGVLVTPHEPSEDSPEDQGHERPHHGGPPAPEMLSDTTGLLLVTLIPNTCILHPMVLANAPLALRGELPSKGRVAALRKESVVNMNALRRRWLRPWASST